jgi:hypothetical protein
MDEHSVYWRKLVAKGLVVIVGPYGLCVLRLPDGMDPRPLCSDDPVIRAGIGFRVEVAPMASAIVPEPA